MATDYGSNPISKLKFGNTTYQIKDAELNKEIVKYLPLSGGTMTGDLSSEAKIVIQRPHELTSGIDDTLGLQQDRLVHTANDGIHNFTFPSTTADFVVYNPPTLTGSQEFTFAIKEDLNAVYDNLNQKIAGGVHFIGLNTGTAAANIIKDGEDQMPVIAGYTVKSVGDIVMQNETGPDGETVTVEYIYTRDSKWEKLGANDTTNFGSLAYKNSASASYTPTGTVTVSSTTIGDKTLNITTKTFTGQNTNVSGSITMKALTGTYNLTCDQISVAASFAGTAATIQPSADFGGKSPSATISYTSAEATGWLDAPEISISADYSTTVQPTVSAYGHTATAIADASITNTPTNLTCTSTVTGTSIAGAISGTAAITNSLFGTSNVINSTTYTASTETLEFTTTAVFDKCATNAKAALTLASKANITVSASGTYSKATAFTAKYDKLVAVTMNNLTVSGVATATFTPSGTVYVNYDKATGVAVTLPSIVCKPISYTPAGNITTTKFTPAGTVKVTETPVVSAFSLSCTPSGTIDVAGKVNIPSHTHTAAFGGTAATITVS